MISPFIAYPGNRRRRLPPEICDLIIDWLWDDLRALKRCRRVCKDWVPRSRRHLFHTVRIHWPGSPFFGLTRGHPIVSCVRHVILWSPDTLNVLSVLTRAEHLSILGWGTYAMSTQARPTPAPSVKMLTLGYGNGHMFPWDFDGIMRMLPNLARLELTCLTGLPHVYNTSCTRRPNRAKKVLQGLSVCGTDNHITFWLTRRLLIRDMTNLELSVEHKDDVAWLSYLLGIGRGPQHLSLFFPSISGMSPETLKLLNGILVSSDADTQTLHLHCNYSTLWAHRASDADPILIILNRVSHLALAAVRIHIKLAKVHLHEFGCGSSTLAWQRIDEHLVRLARNASPPLSVEVTVENLFEWRDWKDSAASFVESRMLCSRSAGAQVKVQCI